MLGVTRGVWGAAVDVIRLIKPARSEPVPPGIMWGLSAGGLGNRGGLGSGGAGVGWLCPAGA